MASADNTSPRSSEAETKEEDKKYRVYVQVFDFPTLSGSFDSLLEAEKHADEMRVRTRGAATFIKRW